MTRLGASVDPVSKTIRITANINPGDAMVLPGMSGAATFEEPEDEPVAEPDGEADNASEIAQETPEQAESDGSQQP